jgi:small subunit ribosomal protein S6
MHTYETLFITTPNLTEDEEQATLQALSQVVTDGGGTLVANERMGRRRLAYPIKKYTDGVYVRFLYDAEAAVPKELERKIRISDRILRVLTVRLDGNWATFSKEQAVRDALARVEAAEREAREREAGTWTGGDRPTEGTADRAPAGRGAATGERDDADDPSLDDDVDERD